MRIEKNILLLAFSFSLLAFAQAQQKPFRLNPLISEKDYKHGKIIIKLKPELRPVASKNKISEQKLENIFSALMEISGITAWWPCAYPPKNYRMKAISPVTA